MAKKDDDLLGGFKFEKLQGINNGIEIPTTNSISKSLPKSKIVYKPIKQKEVKKKHIESGTVNIPSLDYKNKAEVNFLVNVVPKASKKVSNIKAGVNTKLISDNIKIVDNLVEYSAIQDKKEKILYLAQRGWSLKIEKRRNTYYQYATKYINRKKQRIYLGSIND